MNIYQHYLYILEFVLKILIIWRGNFKTCIHKYCCSILKTIYLIISILYTPICSFLKNNTTINIMFICLLLFIILIRLCNKIKTCKLIICKRISESSMLCRRCTRRPRFGPSSDYCDGVGSISLAEVSFAYRSSNSHIAPFLHLSSRNILKCTYFIFYLLRTNCNKQKN